MNFRETTIKNSDGSVTTVTSTSYGKNGWLGTTHSVERKESPEQIKEKKRMKEIEAFSAIQDAKVQKMIDDMNKSAEKAQQNLKNNLERYEQQKREWLSLSKSQTPTQFLERFSKETVRFLSMDARDPSNELPEYMEAVRINYFYDDYLKVIWSKEQRAEWQNYLLEIKKVIRTEQAEERARKKEEREKQAEEQARLAQLAKEQEKENILWILKFIGIPLIGIILLLIWIFS